ncbi:MAG: cation diffusion facilitator family transporter [Chthoniobacterales bacterium]
MSAATHPPAAVANLQTGARVALLGLTINMALAAAKLIAGVVGNAYVLIADGIESAFDIAGSIVIWGGLKFAARPPDATHPYGHGKAEPLAAVAVAIGVLAAALALAVQSVRELFLPHHAPAAFTLVVLVAAIVVKELWYRRVVRFGRTAESTAVQTDAWHHRTDALTSIAAFVGITISLLGGEAWQSADDWAALFACGLIATNGARLLRPALHEIMDTAPRGEIVDLVSRAAASAPGVLEVDKCLVRKMGLSFYADLHIGVDANIPVREGHHIAHVVKRAIQQVDPRIADVLVHVEPASMKARS